MTISLPLTEGAGRVATIFSIVVAILAAALKAFKYQENWINYRTTCETLKKEWFYYEARIGDYSTAEDPQALFVERSEALISRENTMWTARKTLIFATDGRNSGNRTD